MDNGKNPVIAIIDTGIDTCFSYSNDIVGNIDFFTENQSIYISEGSSDKIGHGTKVASCIKKYCPQASLYIINIYRAGEVTYSGLLLEALNYLLNVKVDIINISLAVNSNVNVIDIDDALKRLNEQGKIIVAAVRNGLKTSFPAESPYCIGVLGVKSIPNGKFQIDEKKRIQIVTSRLPVTVETLGGEKVAFGGNSKAAACVSGCIAAVLKGNNTFLADSICSELKKKLAEGEIEWIV